MLSPKSDPKFASGSAIADPKPKKLNIVNKILTNGPILTKRVALRRGGAVVMHCCKSFNLDSNGHVDTGSRTFETPGLNPGPIFSPTFQTKDATFF